MGFLGRNNWSPGGFVSPKDESVQNFYTQHSSNAVAELYAYDFPYDGRQVADFTGNQHGYIPTEIELGAAIAIRNMMLLDSESPYEANDPQQNQILQNLYQQTAAFWEDIRAASGTVG